ncbi:MAG TPA: ABC transporter ATP-binding protein [Candidatus Polarisedimenticolia bacterium]|nr:ABC transporter ATP-binding protein [Candidatus Polarisedimenticolia bacterium]
MTRGTEAGPAAIEARAVRFGYGRDALFDGLDLAVARGSMTALIGPNGSGKTTLIRLLSGSIPPQGGELLLEGRLLSRLAPRARARLLAVVPQDTALTFDVTVLEMVLMGRTPYLGWLGLESHGDLAAARRAMACTGTLPFASRLLSRLSGGERQLAVVARALAQEPRTLLLDEPTAYLDVRHRLQVYELLARLNRESGLTILTTSHDINLAARYCGRMVLLKDGRIRADGPAAQVFQPAILAEVYGTPLHVFSDPVTGTPHAVPGRPAAGSVDVPAGPVL